MRSDLPPDDFHVRANLLRFSAVWVRASAIRPVGVFARVPRGALDAVHRALTAEEEQAQEMLDHAFDRFEGAQPCLSAHIGDVLGGPLDETATALGYFLALSVWLAFDQAHANRVEAVSPESVCATQELLVLDEELRRADPTESLDSEDVIGMEQPHLMDFVHEQVNATLDAHTSMDVNDMDVIYRVILVEILSLSYAVGRPAGFPAHRAEIQA